MKQFDPNNINGVIPAMITSFNKDESINKEGIRKTVNYLISAKVDGLYITGSTGAVSYTHLTLPTKRIV